MHSSKDEEAERAAYAPRNRGRSWMIRQIVGMGTAEEINEGHPIVMKTGQTGRSNTLIVRPKSVLILIIL